MSEEITINELLKGKATLIKNKEFFPTKNYVEPFLERMSKFTNDFRVQIVKADQVSKQNNVEDTVYNRVLVQGVLPEKYSIDNHKETIGFLYGLDVRKPVVSFYKGYINSACTNLTIFNPEWIFNQELIAGEPINYSPIKYALEITSDFESKLKKLKSTFIERDERISYLGTWVDNTIRKHYDTGYGKVKISPSHAVEAYKSLFIDSESDYFIPEGISPSLFDIYGAFTQVITDDKRDLLQKANKTLLIKDILSI